MGGGTNLLGHLKNYKAIAQWPDMNRKCPWCNLIKGNIVPTTSPHYPELSREVEGGTQDTDGDIDIEMHSGRIHPIKFWPFTCQNKAKNCSY